ncbi:uncharacterized protein LOC133037864 isoform X3 [Cannabis sativa]|uniref:uncharacterized protein LOC133037864 isoform X3 n=1 Tax=Cannabis sativa TaxID=3483 RepID=UPI0029CAA151|nr:uncharacterized protein LOC133037864 isoform X3 [Cannabis sativa]
MDLSLKMLFVLQKMRMMKIPLRRKTRMINSTMTKEMIIMTMKLMMMMMIWVEMVLVLVRMRLTRAMFVTMRVLLSPRLFRGMMIPARSMMPRILTLWNLLQRSNRCISCLDIIFVCAFFCVFLCFVFVLIVFYCFFCYQPEQSQGGEENIDVDATIASAVKAVENLIGSSTHAPAPVETSEKTDLEMVVFQETPILRPQKRDRKKGAVLKSPFIELASGASKSGSSSVSPDDSVYKVVKYVRGLCPLDNKIGEPVDPQLEAEFVKWVDSGLRKHKSK